MGTLWGREPALILTAVNAIIALLVGFGLNLSPEQQALIYAAISAVLGVVVRQQVTSPATLAAQYEPRHDRD